MALQLSEVVAAQRVIYSYLPLIQRGIDAFLHLIRDLPIVGPAVAKSDIAGTTKRTAAIVAAADVTPEDIRLLQSAITEGNLKSLDQCRDHLSKAVATLQQFRTETP